MNKTKKVDLASLSSDEFLRLVESATPEELMALSGPMKSPTTTVVSRVLSVSESERGFRDMTRWWESRRLLYNLLVALCGLPALAWLMFHDRTPMFWLWPTFLYALAANACYTIGCLSEYLAKRFFGEKAIHYGPINFALGTIFSMLLTLVLGFLFITALIHFTH